MLFEEEREAELRELVARLDHLIPRDGAHVMVPGPDGPYSSIGNRVGFLRLGIEVLVSALDPVPGPDGDPPFIAPRLDYLVADEARTPLDVCELDEAIGSRPPVESRLGPVGQLLAGVLLTLAAILALVAVARVWQWLFG
jgi:hypothetical protein